MTRLYLGEQAQRVSEHCKSDNGKSFSLLAERHNYVQGTYLRVYQSFNPDAVIIDDKQDRSMGELEHQVRIVASAEAIDFLILLLRSSFKHKKSYLNSISFPPQFTPNFRPKFKESSLQYLRREAPFAPDMEKIK